MTETSTESAPPSESATPDSEPEALKIADQVMDGLGGQDAWDDTRYLSWNFFGVRRHFWDKQTDDVRIEGEDVIILMNLGTRVGSVQKGGVEITDPDAIANYMTRGFEWWTNDSYWIFMPYKLRDPGVILKTSGTSTLPDGRFGDILDVTFAEGTGLTSSNRYELFVNRETGLVEHWSFYADRDDPAPKFSLPWADWKKFGNIMLATSHGQGKNWDIDVPETLPESVFKLFEDVAL